MNREIAVSLGLARKAAGSPSFTDVRDQLRDLIGDPCPSIELLRRWHSPDTVPDKRLELPVLAGLAAIYRLKLSDLHPDLEADADRVRDLLDHVQSDDSRRHTGGYDGPERRAVPFRRVAAA